MKNWSSHNTLIKIYHSNFLECCASWDTPTVIISDGPYGISGFEGDMKSTEELQNWYDPFFDVWTSCSTPNTTLWFWNTEPGWASVHNLFISKGWDFVNCHI